MMEPIMAVQGWILTFIYSIIPNYGVAIILFTLAVKLLLFPLDLKQKRSMAKTQKIQPLLNDIQKKYGGDKERLSQETMKLYQKYGISPMSGCLPMLIQLPIIFALFYVVKKPLIYMIGVDFEGIRYDMGNKLGMMKAVVETALKHKEIGEEFREYLKTLKF